ncbi:uncharacterized protein [Paramormyrops kingsleyae]|uniref:uncharacterized protein isoform X1 n=1 Tax=Paramormyrops kingsleyae TaxID=1676925 RepID=UPI003B96C71B
MGYSCCVKGCHTKSQGRKVDHNIRFFRIPTWKRGYVRQVEKGPWRRDWPNNTAFLIIHPIRGASRSHGRRLVLHTDWPSPTMAPKCPASSKPSGSSEPNRQRKTLTIQEKVKLLDILRLSPQSGHWVRSTCLLRWLKATHSDPDAMHYGYAMTHHGKHEDEDEDKDEDPLTSDVVKTT